MPQLYQLLNKPRLNLGPSTTAHVDYAKYFLRILVLLKFVWVSNRIHTSAYSCILFNLKIFTIRSFQWKSAHDGVIKNLGHPNCLIIARTSNWNLLQNAGIPLMEFINTNPLPEVTKVKFLFNIPSVTFEEENLFIATFMLLFSFNCCRTNWKKNPHTMKISPCN